MSLLGYYILHYLTLSSYSPLWFVYSPSHCRTESCYVGLACWWNHWNPTTTSIQSCRNSGGAHRDCAGGTGQGDRGARGEVGMGSQHVSSRRNGKHMMNTCDLQDVTTIVSKWMTSRNWVFLPYIFWTARLIAIPTIVNFSWDFFVFGWDSWPWDKALGTLRSTEIKIIYQINSKKSVRLTSWRAEERPGFDPWGNMSQEWA